ncbi:hypothetical protein FHS57_003853 [Runella defluvii]|uniref:Uncharacterized protein n=1 Tax=Runella defluvii TaxID=370973 RepID=A0A7W5ZLX9_9BACT|nr:hypothetical protein [Runella defluvii]MBB3839842.1 hypothetical protein [Runella defluvii]
MKKNGIRRTPSDEFTDKINSIITRVLELPKKEQLEAFILNELKAWK